MQRSRNPPTDGPFAIALFVVACVVASPARAAEPTVLLQPASGLDVQLAAGEHRRYRVALGPEKTVVLSIRQNDAMLHLRIAAADGPLSPALFTQAGRQATLQSHFVADTASEWTLDIAAAKADRAASFRLMLGPAHATRTDDRLALSAEHAMAAAESIRIAAGGVEPGRQPADVDAAREGYSLAATQWRKAGQPCSAMVAEVGLARLELALARYRQAQAAAEIALRDCDTADPTTDADRAAALRTLASALGYQGDFEAAADQAERALAIYRRTGDRRFEGVVLGNLSADYRSLGETQKATTSAQAALDIALATGDAQGVEFSRDNLADSHLARGEFGRALAIYRETLDDLRKTPYPLAEGLVWNELGMLYRRMGEPAAADDAWAHARDVWASSGNRSGMAETWIGMGDAALDDGAIANAAAAFTRALEIARTDHLRSPEVHALRGLAGVAAAGHDSALARTHLNASLDLAQALDDRAGIVAAGQAFGDLEAGEGHWPEARARYATVLAAATRSGDASAQAAAFASLARVALAQRDFDAASTGIDRALAIVESQRAEIADPGLRTGFFASQHAYYALAVDIEMTQEERAPDRGHRERALEIAERARARSLQDTLAERAIDIGARVDPALLATEREAHDTQRRLAYRLARSESSMTTSQRAQLQREMERAGRDLDAARGSIRRSNPRYADIAHPAPLRASDLRAQLLDPDTAILEYWIGESTSYLWIVERTGVRSYVLPSRAVIASASRALRDRVLASTNDDSALPIERRMARDAQSLAAARQTAVELADIVLPADARIRRAHTWAIVADGELEDVPFALLADALFDADAPAIVHLPSIGALRGLRGLPLAKTPAQALAIVADPVFARSDPRLASPPASSSASRAADAGVTDLALLPQARAEADDVGALGAARPTRRLLGFDATRDAVLGADWSDVAIVHFATHALVDADDPALSGIVLSLYERDGRPKDGFLRIDDLYALDMPADLVVLGVCDAAAGRQVGGEGVLSLAQAFFHAGTRHVLASLWPVDDRASAVFMHAFHAALLQQGMRPQAALAAAQAQMRQNPRYAAPYYWSGFVVQGDWR